MLSLSLCLTVMKDRKRGGTVALVANIIPPPCPIARHSAQFGDSSLMSAAYCTILSLGYGSYKIVAAESKRMAWRWVWPGVKLGLACLSGVQGREDGRTGGGVLVICSA